MIKNLFILLLVTGCASETKEEQVAKLDIPIESKKKQPAQTSKDIQTNKELPKDATNPNKTMSQQPKFEWQQFFQKPPSPNEKPLLTKKLRFFGHSDKKTQNAVLS